MLLRQLFKRIISSKNLKLSATANYIYPLERNLIPSANQYFLFNFQYQQLRFLSSSSISRCRIVLNSSVSEKANSKSSLEEESKEKNDHGRLFLSFTCKVCSGSNSYTFSKRAYNHGVVIVTCKFCENHHLVADNLNWFNDVSKNIEEILAEKGEKITKIMSKEILPESEVESNSDSNEIKKIDK